MTIRGALRMMGKLVKIGEVPSFLTVTLAVVLVAVAPTGSTALTPTVAITITASAVAVATTVTTAVAARFLLLITFRFREQHLVRQSVLAGLFVDFDELHLDLVAHVEHVSHIVDAAVSDFGDVQ